MVLMTANISIKIAFLWNNMASCSQTDWSQKFGENYHLLWKLMQQVWICKIKIENVLAIKEITVCYYNLKRQHAKKKFIDAYHKRLN
jgi:hypothetical protein